MSAADTAAASMSLEEQMIASASLSFERLPMLDVIFSRSVPGMTTALKGFTSSLAEVTLEEVDYCTWGKALDALPQPALLAIADAQPWNGPLLLAIEGPFLHDALEIMLGGEGGGAGARGSFTSIERRVGQRLAELAFAELRDSFRQICDVTLDVERMEVNPRLATVTQPASPCARVTLGAAINGRAGRMVFLIPYATLDPVRPLLTKVFFGDKLGGDSPWREHLTRNIGESRVTLTAVLHQLQVPLSEVLEWQAGQTLDLGIAPDHEASVMCAGVPMFMGATGKRHNGAVALRITHDLNEGSKERDDDADD